MLTLYRIPGIAKLGEGYLDEINTFSVIDGFDELVPLSGKARLCGSPYFLCFLSHGDSFDFECFVVIRIQNHEFQTAVYSSLALFEIYKLHIVSVSEK